VLALCVQSDTAGPTRSRSLPPTLTRPLLCPVCGRSGVCVRVVGEAVVAVVLAWLWLGCV